MSFMIMINTICNILFNIIYKCICNIIFNIIKIIFCKYKRNAPSNITRSTINNIYYNTINTLIKPINLKYSNSIIINIIYNIYYNYYIIYYIIYYINNINSNTILYSTTILLDPLYCADKVNLSRPTNQIFINI